MASNCLPDYQSPPVAETILGIQFEPLPSFRNGHLGAFWQRLGPQWPNTQDVPPLEPQFERFDVAGSWQALGIRLRVAEPASRIQIRNSTGDRMIQIQNGRFHLNWLRIPDRNYPRYEAVKNEFTETLELFRGFIKENDLGEFKPNQWEITYINSIDQGTVWSTPPQWSFFRPLAGSPSLGELAELESLGAEWHYVLPEKHGRLHIQWQHGQQDDHELVNLTLTARGPVPGAECSAAFDGLDLGHIAIVGAFKNLMSEEANRYWKLKDATS